MQRMVQTLLGRPSFERIGLSSPDPLVFAVRRVDGRVGEERLGGSFLEKGVE